MMTRRREWYGFKETSEQVRGTDLKKYNNILTSWRWSTKDTKDSYILDLVGMAQNIADH